MKQTFERLPWPVATLAPVLLSAALVPSVHGAGGPAAPQSLIPLFGDNYCSKTSQAAFSACMFEWQDEYFLQRGKCFNIADEEEADECLGEARVERRDGQEECKEQYEAREDVCDLVGGAAYDPEYEPADFVDPETIGYGPGDVAPNPWFPLVPGTRWVYEAEDEIITVEVLEETIEIDGVTCAVVRDVVVETGEGEEEEDGMQPVEDTMDWYAQDLDGNVWYFGEISFNYEDGQIADIEGSWKTGEDGARPGILMPAAPMEGDVYRQEFLLGEAEDMAQVVSTAAMPELGEDNVGDCDLGCLQTLEWTPLEADSFEFKYYEPGVGMVQEADPEDPESTVELVEFSPPGG